MKQILLVNAYVAWKKAIKFHDLIEKGNPSFQNQKEFVSSLHNAVELFLKQMMLNANDHNVATVRKTNSLEEAELAVEYYRATDLNLFFSNLKQADLDRFNSIEFGILIDRHKKIIGGSIGDKTFKDVLKVLQTLRNNETHFFVDASGYLSEEYFVLIHNFMIDFYKIILENKMFPKAMIKFDDMTHHLVDEQRFMEFNRTTYKTFSYVETLKNNKLVLLLKDIMKDENESEYAHNAFNIFSLAESIVYHHPELNEEIDEIFTMLNLMYSYNLYEIRSDIEEIELDNGSFYTNHEEWFEIKF